MNFTHQINFAQQMNFLWFRFVDGNQPGQRLSQVKLLPPGQLLSQGQLLTPGEFFQPGEFFSPGELKPTR